ncbi:MAG: hypothetical protein OER92_06270 [Alphaproteobacteria bacterium]|nr:hypothetical protein [Alphaproteobacteria bacterium]
MATIRVSAASAILVAALFQAGGADAQRQNVQIVRGGQPTSISEVRESDVRVFRGTPSTEMVAADHGAPEPAFDIQAVSSGSKIWFVDRAAGKLSVCSLVKTTQVGERRIDCYSRSLPL